MATIIFGAQFIVDKVGKSDLTPTVDIEQITRSDGTRVALLTGGNASVVGRRGLYYYRLINADLTLYDYIATFITDNADVDQQEIAAMWTLWSLSWHDILTAGLTAANSIGKLLVDNLTAILADTGMDGVVLADDAITAAKIAANAITSSELADGAITAAKIADNAITAAKIATDAIGADELAASAASEIATVVWAAGARTLTAFAFVADIAAAVWAYATRVITGGGGSAADIWAYEQRTLTQSAASVTAAVAGSDLNILRGDTWTASLTGLGSLAGHSKLWFTVKLRKSTADTGAIVQVEKAGNLLCLNGAAPAAGQTGTITVDDEDDGDITITLNPAATAVLEECNDLHYDVQILVGTTVHTVTEGVCDISADVTRAIS